MTGDNRPSQATAEDQVAGTWSEVLEQRFDNGSLYQLRAAVAAHAVALGASSALANDIVLAVHELASNSVLHGPGQGRVRMWQDHATVICEIAEGDPTGPARLASQLTSGPPDLPWTVEHGHGLWLVSQVADQFTVRRDRKGATAAISFTARP